MSMAQLRVLRWPVLLAAAVVAGAACVADIQLPWMTLIVEGGEQAEGRLVSYCWSSVMVVCADGDRTDPTMSVVRSAQPVSVQVRTKPGIRELHVGVTAVNPRDVPQNMYAPPTQIDPSRAETLKLAPGTHYISVFARWERGNGYFVFGLRVDAP
jgi:hypothetical protein